MEVYIKVKLDFISIILYSATKQAGLAPFLYNMFSIYTFTAVVLFLFSLSSFSHNVNNKRVKVTLIVSIIWLILYEGFRWEIGTDWSHYYESFIHGYSKDDLHVEKGYIFLNNFMGYVLPNYSCYLLLLSTFFYLVIYKILIKYSISPLTSLCIYYCTMLGYLGCNRQLIAIMICLLSLKYIIDKKWWPFLLMMIVAFSFHTTSLIFLPAYFIVNANFKSRTIIALIIITLLIGQSGIIDRIPYVNYVSLLDANSSEKLSVYSNYIDVNQFSVLGVLKRLIIIIPSLFVLHKSNNFINNTFIKLYITGCLIYFTFNGSVLMLMSGRGAMYYNVTEMLVIPILIKHYFKNMDIQRLVWFSYFCLVLYIMLRDINNYYLMLDEDIFRPYKTVLFQ